MEKMKNKIVIIINVGIFGLLALFLLLPVNPASAQNGAWLAFSPEESSVPLGNQAVLELVVTAGANINAYDLTLSYDPAIILLTDWEHGDYLSNLVVVMEDNTPGTFRLAVTQLAQPEVSGDGVLLELVFETQAEGDSLVEIVEAVFADSQGGSLYPELVNGWVFVALEPTFTPTLTPTPEASKEATPEDIPTLTATSAVQEIDSTPQITTGLPDGGQENREGTPDPQNEEGYQLESEMEGQDLGGNTQGDKISLEVGNQDSESNPSDAYAEPETQEDASLEGKQEGNLNLVLWIVVIVSVAMLVPMIVIIIRRKNRKNEDLLL